MTRQAITKVPPIEGRGIMVLLAVSGALAAAFYWGWMETTAQPPQPGEFRLEAESTAFAAYGGSASCRECHEEAFEAWAGSNHALAERNPSAATEDVAFVPGRTFHHGTQNTSVRANGGRYEVVAAGETSSNQAFSVERILGNMPLRQMLLPLTGGRLQASEAAWDPRSNEWFNVYGAEDRKPGEWGHWAGRGMNWNSMCAACHNTRVRKNYDAARDSYQTAMVENGVGCETCHGPMKSHNTWQFANRGKGLKDPTIRKFTRQEMFEACAACHSRRAEITGDAKAGDSYWDHHLLSIVDESNLFYPDGQIWDEDFEYTAFLGSRMHNKGVRCVDCHDFHTMKVKLPGNFLCLSCHGQGMTNAPVIDPVKHSWHKVYGYDTNGLLISADLTAYKPALIKETGGECVNCHMPQTPYMQRHWRHDHGFTIPDPLLTKQFSIPNACNRCHQDKTTEWSIEYVDKWYGAKMDRPYRQRAQAVAQARQGLAGARTAVVNMIQTDEIPYWRAVAANLLQRWAADPQVTTVLTGQLQNTNALVREMVVRALGSLVGSGMPGIEPALRQSLRDASRNVRIEAARLFATSLDTNSPAGRDYLYFLAHTSDQPLGQMQAGVFKAMRGDPAGALPHFRTAVQWDPFSPGLRHELAVLLSRLGQTRESVSQLEEAVRLAPRDAEFHFKLALALNEVGESVRVVSELQLAVDCDPGHARAWYNLGLARSARGDDMGALEALIRAESVEPSDSAMPYARATILARMGRLEEARAAARHALEVRPNDSAASALLQQLGGR